MISERQVWTSSAPTTRSTSSGLDFWADPVQQRPQEINTRDGGRGCYFLGPGGHFPEILTRPYGSGG